MSQVVIVDDQKANQLVFSRIAQSIDEDVEVRTFGDPQLALDWLKDNIPDLIVTDYNMPGIDGAEFTRRLRCIAALADVPVIVITVYEERSLRLRALNAGATDFLQSPIDQREFVTRARNLLKMRKQQLLLADRADHLERRLEDSERSLKRAVRDSSERLAQVIDTVPAMISATDEEGRFLFINGYQAALIGADPSQIVGKNVSDVLGESQGSRSLALDRMVLETGAAVPSFEESVVDRLGMHRVFLTSKSPLRDSSERVIGVVTSSIDITDVKLAEKTLFRMANHDPLTGLPDRTVLSERVRREVILSRQGERRFAFHFIDLDELKRLNKAYGHSTGDRVLRNVALRLRRISREGDTVARLSSDEFAILRAGADADDAAAFAEQITHALIEPHSIWGESVTATASVGIVLFPGDAETFEDILERGQQAAVAAQSEGGNRYRFFARGAGSRSEQVQQPPCDSAGSLSAFGQFGTIARSVIPSSTEPSHLVAQY